MSACLGTPGMITVLSFSVSWQTISMKMQHLPYHQETYYYYYLFVQERYHEKTHLA